METDEATEAVITTVTEEATDTAEKSTSPAEVPDTIEPTQTTTVAAITATETEEAGQSLGQLSTLKYEVSGEVFRVGDHSLKIKNFNYNGEGMYQSIRCLKMTDANGSS